MNIIKSHVFPKGLTAVAFRTNDSITSQMSEVLYHNYYRDGNSFVFNTSSVKANEEFGYSDMINNEKSQLYCCCVVFEDLVLNPYFGQQYIVPRCYCLVSFFPCFELHFEILYRLLAVKRAQRFENTSTVMDTLDTYEASKDIFNGEELGLIETFYEYENESTTNKFVQVSITLQSVEHIDYIFPSDYYYLDKLWLCPVLFSLLNPNDLYFLLCAVMLEKSVIFCSKNLDFLSSCVLGLQSLILPLKSQHKIISVLVEADFKELNDDYESFIVGYPGCLSANIDFWIGKAIVVNLDENSYTKKISYGKDIVFKQKTCLTYSLVEKIKEPYTLFKHRIIYIPDDIETQSEKIIIEEIKNFIN